MPGFDLQPVLCGELLSLRPLRDGDFNELYDVAADPLVWEQHPERERYRLDVFKTFFAAAMDSKGALVAVDNVSAKIIGSSRFSNFDPIKNQIEVGYTFLARSYWGRNYNLEMKKLMLGHAFQFVDKIVFFIGENNFRSRKAIERIGATFFARIERAPKQGAQYDAVMYLISKSEWIDR